MKHGEKLITMILAALLLAAVSCSQGPDDLTGAGEENAVLDRGLVTGTSWNHNDYFSMGSDRYYLNNQWGIYDTNREASGSWQKCYKNSSGKYSVEYNLWTANQANDIVLGYPSILNGWHYGQVNPSNGKCGFPVRIYDNKKIMTSWSVSHENWGNWECLNSAYDIWIGQVDKTNPSSPDTEVMIWLYRQNQSPIGSRYYKNGKAVSVYFWGATWDVYASWPGQSGNPGWTVFSFLRTSNTLSASNVNISDFIYWLWKTENLLDGRKYIVGVEAGQEIIQGKGKFVNNSFNLYVQ
jgi:hypothetical protein